MSRRRTRCLPLWPTSTAPPPTQWIAFCGRIIEEADARELDLRDGPRPAGICPRCWPRAKATVEARIAFSLVEPGSSQRTCFSIYPPRSAP